MNPPFLCLPWTLRVGFGLSFALGPIAGAADWLHYRGPTMNGVSSERIAPALPSDGPRPLWKASVGTGTSAVTVSGASGQERAYTMGNVAGKDVVYCFEAKSGRELWRHEYPLKLDTRMFEGGPAATPTLDGNRLYTLSHQGDLFCLDATTGKKIWYRHYQQDFQGRRPQWGYAGSPTIEGAMLICDVGGKGSSTVALDKSTGEVIWKSGEDEAGYASPVVASFGAKRTVLVFKSNALIGLDAKTGIPLWRTAWKTSYSVNAATPLVIGNTILVSSGYGTGCGLFEVSEGQINERWHNKNLRSHVNSPVFVGGYYYGLDGQADPKSPLVCLDAATGALKWSDKSVGGGSLILAGNQLVILTERGELVSGPASPEGLKPNLRAQVLGGRCWVQPTLSGGRLFVKNNQGALVCLDLSPK